MVVNKLAAKHCHIYKKCCIFVLTLFSQLVFSKQLFHKPWIICTIIIRYTTPVKSYTNLLVCKTIKKWPFSYGKNISCLESAKWVLKDQVVKKRSIHHVVNKLQKIYCFYDVYSKRMLYLCVDSLLWNEFWNRGVTESSVSQLVGLRAFHFHYC